MPVIIIDLSNDKTNLILSGAISELLANKRAVRYLKDFLSPSIGDNEICIPTHDTPELAIKKVRAMLQKYGFAENKTKSVAENLSSYYEEERRFDTFSLKAYNIRNNDCDSDEFALFTSVLQAGMKKRTLYPLQLLSAFHLAFAQNACNFSVPGSGKTSIVYGAYTYLKSLPYHENKHVSKLLIVGPLSSFGPWEDEYCSCFGIRATATRLGSALTPQEKTHYLYSSKTSEITLISYSSLCNHLDDIGYFLRNNKVMVVLDEAHKIKNVDGGAQATAALSISKYCTSRVVLTGTPAPNGYEDLYNLYKFIWPTKDIIKFKVNQLQDISKKQDRERVNSLIESISPFFIRIRKSDLNLPEAITHPGITVRLGKHQRSIYDAIERKYMNQIIDDNNYSTSDRFKAQLIRAKLIRLMQAATDPTMLRYPLERMLDEEGTDIDISAPVDDQDIIGAILNYEKNEIPAKFYEVERIIRKMISSGQKVVVWATFIHTINRLKQFLFDCGINAQVIYGAVPVESSQQDEEDDSLELTREQIIRDFHLPNSTFKVLIANPQTVAESISLHKACHNAIYIERSFNAAHFMQSKDRIHRYGLSPDTVTNYYFIIAEDTIDNVIDTRLVMKEARMIEVMESQPIPLFDNVNQDLGNEDIKELIKQYVSRSKQMQ